MTASLTADSSNAPNQIKANTHAKRNIKTIIMKIRIVKEKNKWFVEYKNTLSFIWKRECEPYGDSLFSTSTIDISYDTEEKAKLRVAEIVLK